jgi:hypothetical protein
MTRIATILIALLTLLISQAAVAGNGLLFQVSATGIPAGTNGSVVNLTLCLNGNGPLSCQNFTVSTLNLSISTTAPNHTYPAVGIKINTPGYTPTGCTQTSNGYCLFAASNTSAANISLSTNNIAPMSVDTGPPGVNAQNTAFVSITVCEPGTSNCQVINNIEVDTGSTGIRLIADVLNHNLKLPAIQTNGAAVAECYTYVSSSVWGSVKTADVTIGGETAHSVPVQIMGDRASPYATVPASCPGPITDTVVSFGANGIIGVNNSNPDCGMLCTNSSPPVSAFYYTCNNSDCTASTNLPLALQVPNPATYFATDNNGVILQLPAIPDAGATSVLGSLIFGIGTQPNNQLGNATIYPTTSNGNFKTIYNNVLHVSYTDSGTNEYIFPNDSIPPIPVLNGYYNPAQPLNLQATMVGHGGMPTGLVNFMLVSEPTLASNITAALIGSPGGGFVWGLSFFFGRTVYTAIDGAYTSAGYGPYIAY